MTLLRLKMDVIINDTADNRRILQTWWEDMKSKKVGFKRILSTEEESYVSIHICNHDDLGFQGQCIEKRRIQFNIITKEDDV